MGDCCQTACSSRVFSRQRSDIRLAICDSSVVNASRRCRIEFGAVVAAFPLVG